MRVLVSGSHGFIASALVPALERAGHTVGRIERTGGGEQLDLSGLADADAVVHLAGAGIGDEKWTPDRKRLVLESRTKPTTQLAEAMAAAREGGPKILVSGSAIGYYGDRGDEELTEDSGPGDQFLSQICQAWEAATKPAEDAGVRVVRLRTGLVLAADGGMLKPLLTPFKLGLGGRIGTGKQWWSWVSIDDEVGAIVHALTNDSVQGALNATAPNPVRQQGFAKALAKALHRPAFLPTPKFAISARLGPEAAQEMTFAGQRVLPAKLQATGYQFTDTDLGAALQRLLA